MKKVSKKVKSKKVNEELFTSLNGEMLKKLKGGTASIGNADHACGTCGTNAGLLSPVLK